MPRTDPWKPCDQGVAIRHQLAASGWSARALDAAVRDGTVIRLHRGVFIPAPRPVRARHLLRDGRPDPGYLALVRAALVSLGRYAVAAERTAAILWGFDLLVEPAEVEVHVPQDHHRAQRQGVLIRRRRAGPSELRSVLGLAPIPVTGAAETVVHCALSRPLREAVVIADSALRSQLLTAEELVSAMTLKPGERGGARLRRVLALVDPGSGSVLESVLRVLLRTHGLHPATQVTLLDAQGRPLGRVDFWFHAARLIVECDGRRWHDPADARERDRRRDNGTARTGCRTLRFTWDEVLTSPQDVLSAIRDCLLLAA